MRGPLAVMDSLRFGPLSEQPLGSLEDGAAPRKNPIDRATIAKNHAVVEGVVAGISHYGNCFGVPNLGGETRF